MTDETPIRPVLMVVDPDADSLDRVADELERRYGADYRVLRVRSARRAETTLRELERRGEELALLLAATGTDGLPGGELLARSREPYPGARYAERVTLLVRSSSLAESMSQYLIEEMAAAKNVELRFETEVIGGGGDGRLRHLTLRGTETGVEETVPAAGVFLMIGAEPHTGWLPDAIQRDRGGYVLTGDDVAVDRRRGERRPGPLETSLPGVFAVGDVRHGSVKRVASAVGEGAVVLSRVHRHLERPA